MSNVGRHDMKSSCLQICRFPGLEDILETQSFSAVDGSNQENVTLFWGANPNGIDYCPFALLLDFTDKVIFSQSLAKVCGMTCATGNLIHRDGQ
jgi:hypothetical protein